MIPVKRLAGVLAWGWYPTLLALLFVGEPFASNDVELTAGARLFSVAILIGVALTLGATRVLDRDRGAAVAAVLVVALVAASGPARFIPFAGAVALISLERARSQRGQMRIRIPWPRVTEAANVFLVVLLGLQIARGVELRLSAPAIPMPPAWAEVGEATGPDIFVILADAHGRSDVLKRDYGYEATELRLILGSNGFDEATRSHANHVLTRFSLAVLLNGRPLSELGQDMDAPVEERLPPVAIRNPSLATLLERAGYEHTVVSSGYDHLQMAGRDRTIEVGPPNEAEQAVWLGTALGDFVDSVTPGVYGARRDRVLRQLAALDELAHTPGDRPQFIFTHLPVPHWPFVFKSDCNLRPSDVLTDGPHTLGFGSGSGLRNPEAIAVAVEQMACVDSLLARELEEIVAARPDAVILVLSDHGPEQLLNWASPAEPGLQGRFANMFWARTPGHDDLFPDDVTLVNVLPILFNAYLGTDLPLHPNDLWFGPSEVSSRFVPYAPSEP